MVALVFCTKLYIKLAVSLGSFSQFSFPFNFRTANALVLKFGTLPLSCRFSNTLLAIFDILFRSRVIHRFVPKNGPKLTCRRVFQHKGTTFFICVSRPAHALISASGEKKKQKNFKENASLWTSSRGQVLSSTGAKKETDCSTQTTVLWRLLEKVNLLVKVVLGSTSLFTVNHGPAGLDCLACRFYWSTGAAEGPIMVDSGTCFRGESPKIFFFGLW